MVRAPLISQCSSFFPVGLGALLITTNILVDCPAMVINSANVFNPPKLLTASLQQSLPSRRRWPAITIHCCDCHRKPGCGAVIRVFPVCEWADLNFVAAHRSRNAR
jgi:hypothetical protein